MEGINNSWLKFESCDYADRLVAKLSQLNSEVDQPIDMNIVKKPSITPKSIMESRKDK